MPVVATPLKCEEEEESDTDVSKASSSSTSYSYNQSLASKCSEDGEGLRGYISLTVNCLDAIVFVGH